MAFSIVPLSIEITVIQMIRQDNRFDSFALARFGNNDVTCVRRSEQLIEDPLDIGGFRLRDERGCPSTGAVVHEQRG
jgi:hypothetical protein